MDPEDNTDDDPVGLPSVADAYYVDVEWLAFQQNFNQLSIPAFAYTEAEMLADLQDQVMGNPRYTAQGGQTFCNQATQAIMAAMGAPMVSGLANDMGWRLLFESGRPDSAYRQVGAREAQRLANSGKLVLASYVNLSPFLPGITHPKGATAPPGHVATLRPEGLARDEGRIYKRGSGSGPLIAQVGRDNEVMRQTWAIDKRNLVLYYTPR
jgi:hypothetical protein